MRLSLLIAKTRTSGWLICLLLSPMVAAENLTPSVTNQTWWAFQPLRRSPPPVTQAFQPAGSGDFPVTRKDPDLPSGGEAGQLPNPPAGKRALQHPFAKRALQHHATRRPSHPIDAFIDARLAQKGLVPNPPATKRELIRRATFNLLGLPPASEEVIAFENDPRPEAWDRLIDRLLARPEYGERWARHWLDVVRFAQSNGYERDGEKPFAWRYRDYVIRAFNADKPYDQFVREHVAGDELEPYSPDAVIATGYARLGVWDDEPDDKLMAEFDELDDVLSTTGVAFLGLTLGCARCHEHKFDPIPHADYYRLLAFFRGVQPTQHIDKLGQSTAHVPLANAEDVRAWSAKHAETLRSLEAELAKAVAETDKKTIAAKIEAAKNQTPPFDHALAMREAGPTPEPTFVLRRGSAHSRSEEVQPGFLSVLGTAGSGAGWQPAVSPIGNRQVQPGLVASPRETSGRRRILADWIASAENPLTPRVIVNRVWHHHFGRGIVPTTGDFGRVGLPPTHPELLDWLAEEFIANGWSLKKLHKLIMTSEAYQRSSRADGVNSAISTPAPATTDPDNQLLWRQNLRRLEAEAVRDSILAISGRLNLASGGRGFFPHLSGEVLAGGSRPGTDWEVSAPAEQSRRSVYAYVRRTQPVPMLEALDYANYFSPLTERPVTTVAPQALLLLNDDFMREQAEAFARRLSLESPSPSANRLRSVVLPSEDSADGLIIRAYQVALARNPTERELKIGRAYLLRQREQFTSLRSRLTFRTDVPATMNVSYFKQLKADDFVVRPTGWTPFRGHWPDQYEGNRTMQRGNGPFAIWPGMGFTNATMTTRILLHTAFESGGILVRASAVGDQLRGYELVFDPREEHVSLRRHDTNVVTLARISRSVPTSRSLPLKVEITGAALRVWLDNEREPALAITDSSPCLQPGSLGVRAWGAALSLDDVHVLADNRLMDIHPAADETNPERRALQSFCLLLLNLNEVLYVD